MAHWKTLFDYEHLGVHDLPQDPVTLKPLDLVVKIVSIERKEMTGSGGKKFNKPVATLEGAAKNLILNPTNLGHLETLFETGEFEAYYGKYITLYAAQVKNPEGKGLVPGIRIRTNLPQQKKLPELDENHPRWEDVRKSLLAKNSNLIQVRQHFTLSKENEEKILRP